MVENLLYVGFVVETIARGIFHHTKVVDLKFAMLIWLTTLSEFDFEIRYIKGKED